jgi:IS5 family transposase
VSRLPDESTILRFRHLLAKHELSAQLRATINATLSQRGLMLKAGTVDDDADCRAQFDQEQQG